MSQIIVDAATKYKFMDTSGSSEVLDDQGHLLGTFIPSPDAILFHLPEIGLPPEEIARRLSPSAKIHTGEEVMARLRSLSGLLWNGKTKLAMNSPISKLLQASRKGKLLHRSLNAFSGT